jgi:hypothetical protein
MNVLETWQTEQQDDSANGRKDQGHEIAHVRVFTGRSPHTVHVFPSRGGSIGRVGGDCDLAIDDGRMSRKHARIERSAAGWQLQDLGARNRGFVDGRGYGAAARGSGSATASWCFGRRRPPWTATRTLRYFRASRR